MIIASNVLQVSRSVGVFMMCWQFRQIQCNHASVQDSTFSFLKLFTAVKIINLCCISNSWPAYEMDYHINISRGYIQIVETHYT